MTALGDARDESHGRGVLDRPVKPDDDSGNYRTTAL
jgi:hypothetical protein